MNLLKKITDKDILGTEHLTSRPPRHAVRAVLVDHEGLIALHNVTKEGFYTVPGGGIEEGESQEIALKRELVEETGCDSEILSELGYIIENRGHQDFCQHSFYYLAKVIGEKGEPDMTEDEISEGIEVEWHSIERAIQLVSSPRHVNYRLRYFQMRDQIVLQEAVKQLAARGRGTLRFPGK